MADLVEIGFVAKTDGIKKANTDLDKLSKGGDKADKSLGKVAKSTAEADKKLANFSRRSGMAGIQFQQFIGQIQGGQSAMVALSQQSADLGFVLGAPLLGAVAGISASVVGMLLPSVLQTKDAMGLLGVVADDLKLSLTGTADGADVLSDSLIKLSKKSESLAKLQISASMQEAEKQIKIASEGIEQALDDAFGSTTESVLRGFSDTLGNAAMKTTGSMEDIIDALSKGNSVALAFGSEAKIGDTIRVIGRKFDITKKQAIELSLSISDIFKEQSVLNIKKFENTLSDLNIATGGSNKEIAKLAKSIIPLLDATSDGVNKLNLLRQAFGDFSSKAAESDKTILKFNDSVASITESIFAQNLAMREGEEIALRYNIAQQLQLKAGEKLPKTINDEITERFRLIKAKKDDLALMKEIAENDKSLTAQIKKNAEELERATKKDAQDFDKLINDVNNFGGAWTSTGSIIVDAFGSMSDAVNDYSKQMDALDKQQSDITDARKKDGADINALNALQAKVNENKTNAELRGMGALTKAGAQFFSEQSKGRKALNAAEKAFSAVEIALALQKASANAIAAVTNQGQGEPYTAFARIAAMTAIMGSLVGGSLGGGSSFDPTESRQESQGTGSLLGSADKSESILESQARFEDIQIDQLFELRGIKSSMNSLASGISLLSRDLVAAGGVGDFSGDLSKSGAGDGSLGTIAVALEGGLIGLGIDKLLGGVLSDVTSSLISGIFGSTKKKVVDSGIDFISKSLGDILNGGVLQAQQFFDIEKTTKKLFGLSKKVSTSTEFQALESSFGSGISNIFKNIGDVVLQSAETLGFETVSQLQSSLMGPLTAVDYAEFKKGLDGDFADTFSMMEVSLVDALGGFNVDIGKISLEGLSGEEVEKELQAIFSKQGDLIAEFLVPSIKEFQQIGEGAFDTLTRVTQEQVIFNDNIEQMGVDLSSLSTVMSIDVAQSVIALMGGLESFSSATNSFFDNFFTDSEKFTQLGSSLSDVFGSLNLPLSTTREGFRELVAGVDLTSESGQELFATLMAINPALDEYISQIEKVENKRLSLSLELLKLQGKGEEALAIERENQLKSLDESLRVIQLAIFAQEDLNAANRTAISFEKERLQAVLDTSRGARDAELTRLSGLRDTLNEEKSIRESALSDAESVLKSAFDNELSLIQSNAAARIDSLNAERSTIESTISSLSGLQSSIDSALGNNSTLSDALSGARSGDFSAAQNLDANSFANLDPANFASKVALDIQQGINRGQLSEIGSLAGSAVSDAERQLNAIERQTASIEQNAASQSKALKAQLNELLVIETGVLSLDKAITQFKDAQLSLDSLNYEQELLKLDMMIESANDVYALHEQAYNEQLTALNSISFGVSSVVEAINTIDISGSSSNIVAAQNTVDESKSEKEQSAQENKDMMFELLQTNKKMAKHLQNFDLNGMDTRVVS